MIELDTWQKDLVLFPTERQEVGANHYVYVDKRGWHTFEPEHCEICKRMHEAEKKNG